MSIVKVQCPECSRSYRVGRESFGRKARCKHCGKMFSLTPSSGDSGLPPTGQSGPPPSPEWATIPARVGRFEVRDRLGAGAFGTVYRAHDPVLDRQVALKVP